MLPCVVTEALDSLTGQYACYFRARETGEAAELRASGGRFPSASLIKIPIALAWARLEAAGELDRAALCDLAAEPQVQGAGFSWLLRQPRLPYQDVLLLMLSLSDNLCTNAIIHKIGMQRLNAIFHDVLGLRETVLQRKMMDLEARAAGRENWIGVDDAVRLFDLVRALDADARAWLEPALLANQDTSLLLRDVPRDTLEFYHKTGSLPGVLHDWGYTADRELFLLTGGVEDEDAANRVFGLVGKALLM